MAFEEEKEEASRLVLYLNRDLCLMPVLAAGYARRYFILQSSGILAYSFEPGSQVRDQISLPGAAISSSAKHRDIHVDSSRVTFHIKCLSSRDFEIWMGALRYRSLNVSTRYSTNAFSRRKFTASGSDDKFSGRKSLSKASQVGALHHATIIVDEMANVGELMFRCERFFDDLDYCRQSMI